MKTRYIIKVTATANADNPNFAEEVKTYYYGRGQYLISDKEVVLDALDIYLVTEYGYKRRYDAVKASKFWDDDKYWEYHVDVIGYTL